LNIEASLTGANIIELEPLQQKREPKEITGDKAVIAKEIVKILRDKAKVI